MKWLPLLIASILPCIASESPLTQTRPRPRHAQPPPAPAVTSEVPAQQAFDPNNITWPLIFQDDFSSASTIDVNNTQARGYKWYVQMFWGYGANKPTSFSVGNGILSINNDNNDWNDCIHTTHPANNSAGWEGTCFAVGTGGIYAEAYMAMSNLGSINGSGWPAFWFDSIYREANKSGNPWGEVDFCEYNPGWFNGDPNTYFVGLHEWSTDQGASSYEHPSVGTAFHRYGALMMPPSGSTPGYLQVYFDGKPGGRINLYSQTSKDLFMLILGSSTAGVTTLRVDWVKVWAADPASSLVQIPAGTLPTPTPSPSATPTPTPTPQPTPTPPQPTPTPPPSGATYSNWLDQLAGWIRDHPATPNP